MKQIGNSIKVCEMFPNEFSYCQGERMLNLTFQFKIIGQIPFFSEITMISYQSLFSEQI